MDKKVKYAVEKYYYDNYRVTTKPEKGYPKGEHGMKLYQQKDDEGNFIYENGKSGGRQHDPIYNDENVKYQIYTLGCSWTYGWGVEQEQTFTHLLGDENTAVHNYGAGGTGFDFAVKTLSEVYIPTSTRQIFIMTVI
jgi:hypothetical protein